MRSSSVSASKARTDYLRLEELVLPKAVPSRGKVPEGLSVKPSQKERVAEGRMRGKPFNRPWCFPKVSGYQQRGLSDPGSQGEEKKTLPHTNNSPIAKHSDPT